MDDTNIIQGVVKREERKATDFKEVDENYVCYLEQKLPDFLHRGDLHQANRLLGYADAMMATCATFLIIPLRNLNDKQEQESLELFLDNNIPNFVCFVIGFLLVTTIWESVNIRSLVIKHVDDFYVIFMIIFMLAVCFLPFSLSLMGHYYEYNCTVYIACVILVAIEILEIIMNIYAFKTPRLLHFYIQSYTKEELAHAKFMMNLKNVVNIMLYITACIFGMHDYRISWSFITIMLLLPYIRKGLFFGHRRIYGYSTKELCVFFSRFKKGNISKERIEAFTDAAVAIVACVLMLDITVEGFPKPSEVKNIGLNRSLKHRFDEFVIFFMTYLTVSLLWYANHTVLQLFHTINVVVLTLQKIFILFVCWIPLASQAVHKYVQKNDEDTRIAIRFGSTVVFTGGVCNFLMFVWGLYAKDKALHKWALANCISSNCRRHLYMILKLLNIPFWSMISLLGTLGPAKYVSTIMCITSACNMMAFVILKLIFANHIGQDGFSRDVSDGNALSSSRKNGTIIENSFINNIEITELSIENLTEISASPCEKVEESNEKKNSTENIGQYKKL